MQIELFYLRCHLKWLSKEGQVLPSSKDSTPLSFFKIQTDPNTNRTFYMFLSAIKNSLLNATNSFIDTPCLSSYGRE